MGYFPFFMDLEGKYCIIIGDGTVAARKAESLRLSGGKVEIYSKGEWNYFMLEKAFLVIAATNDREVNHQISLFCREHGILVNTADSKEESSFLFPSIIQQGSVSIGICTQGGSPLVSAEIRKIVASALPENIGLVTELMSDIREKVKHLPIDSEQKRYLFQTVYEKANEKKGKLSEEEVTAVISQALSEQK